ncbi:hypothetical protein [uncultured Paracoccus sp.]|uniref:hypothetical protein n=1 Tax=uncultured Paracoccus sp. TaxID=189685 RepID=UPI002628243B|nr:hypothetical protein [uncultured Paracoccus sp.]
MLVPALLLVWPMQQAVAPDLQGYRQRAETLLLDGGTLPPDYRGELRDMSPADRIEAIIFLRRAGLMTGRPWTIGDLLAPPTGVQAKPGMPEAAE